MTFLPTFKGPDSDSLSNLCILRKSECTGAGLIAFINLHNSEMFDWTLAFPPSKEHFIPFAIQILQTPHLMVFHFKHLVYVW